MKAIFSLLLAFALVGCSGEQYELKITGEITKVEEGMIYLDDRPIKIKNSSDFNIGQRVKVTLIDKTGEDDWNPDDFRVKELKIIK
ncbi:hypothetical protein [Metabacillus litoralis]|uniref:hypothetical protein n=1 Tax=Metabacillus litoralis TaxID=152268 RepID=UPI001CFE2E67|nr:hypothetical protein [Metabacillus litoralis]